MSTEKVSINRKYRSQWPPNFFVCLALVSVYITYEGAMINHIGRKGNYRIEEKWLPFRNIGQIGLIFHVLGCAKYKVSMIKPVARRVVHRRWQWQHTIIHDCTGSLVNEPISTYLGWQFSVFNSHTLNLPSQFLDFLIFNFNDCIFGQQFFKIVLL